MAPPTVLFLGHGADRTGPPILLNSFQGWLAAQTSTDFGTVLTRSGPLIHQYRTRGPVRILDPRWTLPRVAQQGLARTGHGDAAAAVRAQRDRWHLRGWHDAPLVYVNTASPATLRVLPLISPSSTVVAHIHELEVALRYQLEAGDRDALLRRPDRFIVVSQAVADNLTDLHGVAPRLIEVRHGFVEPVEPVTSAALRRLREERAIDPEAFVVVGSGMTEWRKAPDLFVRLARELRRRTDRLLTFVWVGGATAGPEWWPLDHEARHLGVHDIVRFVGAQQDPGSWFRLSDAFALTSREDAFPLAALEAATAGVPLVTFDTGGMAEFVAASRGGVVVTYPDLDGFVETLAAWAGDEEARRSAGAAAAYHARAHHVTEVGAPLLYRSLLRILERDGNGPATATGDITHGQVSQDR